MSKYLYSLFYSLKGSIATEFRYIPLDNKKPANLEGVRVNCTSLYFLKRISGSPGGTRTPDKAVNSRLLYQLSYRGMVLIDKTT